MLRRLTAALLILSLFSCAFTPRGFTATGLEATLESQLKTKVTFENDIVLFTIYALMNATGYNQENNSAFSQVRKGIREDISLMNLSLKDNQYYMTMRSKQSGMGPGDFFAMTDKVGQAPNFKVEYDNRYMFKEFQDFDQYLIDFYHKANIPLLYDNYKPHYDKAIKEYEQATYPVLVELCTKLNINVANLRPMRVLINLQDMYWRGYCANNEHFPHKPILLMTGPADGPNVINVVHEFMHTFTSPLVKTSTEAALVRHLLASKHSSTALEYYESWSQVIDESLVRAFSVWAMPWDTSQKLAQVRNEVAQGFLATEFIYQRLDNFARYNLPINEFIKTVLLEYADSLKGVPPVEALAATRQRVTLAPGEIVKVPVSIQPAYIDPASLLATSSHPAVAVVENGFIRGITPGESTITLFSKDRLHSVSLDITVRSKSYSLLELWNDTQEFVRLLAEYDLRDILVTVPGISSIRVTHNSRLNLTGLSLTCWGASKVVVHVAGKERHATVSEDGTASIGLLGVAPGSMLRVVAYDDSGLELARHSFTLVNGYQMTRNLSGRYTLHQLLLDSKLMQEVLTETSWDRIVVAVP